MHNSLTIITTLLYSYSALHVSGTLAPIISSLLILHIQTPVTVCRWVGCIFQLWSVTTVAFVWLWGGYTALHVSGTLAPIIRSLLILHKTASSHCVSLGWLYLPALVCHYCRFRVCVGRYSALHVSGTLVLIISTLLILHIQLPVTVCRWVGCVFQLWSVTTVAIATVVTDQCM
jgi:hypothetical protein